MEEDESKYEKVNVILEDGSKYIRVECKFKDGDYIMHPSVGNMMVLKKVDDKNYMHFSYYYSASDKCMIKKDGDNTMQVNYQKFLRLCTDEEKALMDKYIEEDKEKKKKEKKNKKEQSN